MRILLSAMAALAVAGSVAAQTQTLVAPTGYAGAEGDSNNSFPWNRGASSMRYMQVYDSSNFTAQGANGPLLISRLRFRADGAAPATWPGASYGSVEIRMSTCPVDHAAISTTFASNHGADFTVVRSGPLTIGGGSASTPGPFHVDIPLQHAFVYDPANGDLVIDVALDGASFGGGTLVQCDAVSSAATTPGVANGTRLFNTSSHTATTGSTGVNYSLVCGFDYRRIHDLTTTSAGGNGNSSGGGVYFNVGVNAREGVVVRALGVHSQEAAGNTGTLDLWVRSGTHVGFESSSAGWRQVAAGVSFVADGPTNETKVAIPPLVLGQGVTGFCVICTNSVSTGGQSYTNGANSYTDAAITLSAGSANNIALAAGTVNTPRTWNGTLYYEAAGRPVATTFASNNGNSAGGGVYFDLLAHHNSGVQVTSFEVNSSAAAGTPETLSVWTRLGTAAGNEQSPVGWRQVANNVPFIAAGPGRPSLVVLPVPILLNGNFTTGIAMNMAGSFFNYTNGTGTNENYSDGTLDVQTKSSQNVMLAPGTVFSPRVWNGVVHYLVLDPDVLQYVCNEPYGTTIGNSAPSTALPREGTVNNAAWQGDPGRTSFRGNETGRGMLARTAATNTNLATIGWPATLTGSMTIMWWHRMGPAVPPTTAYVCGSSTGSERIFTGGVAGTSLWYRGSPIGDITATVNVQASPGTWQHVALSVDDATGQARWYFDGELDVTRTFTPLTHTWTGTTFRTGWATSTTSTFVLNYDMDDFRVFNVALTEAEVKVAMRGENASAGTYGTPCGLGSISARGGVPSATSGNPNFSVQLTGSNPSQLFINVLGFLPAAFSPVNIAPYFGPGCFLLTQNSTTVLGVTTAAGNANVALGVPRNPALVDLHVYSQYLVFPLGAGAATYGLDISLK